MRDGLRLGRFSGVEVAADPSVVVLALLFAVAMFVHLQGAVPEASPEAAGAHAILSGLAVVLFVFVHEAGHVVAARGKGLGVRSIRLHLFGGYSVIDGVPSPGTEFLVAIAGPVVSVLIGMVTLAIPVVGDLQGLLRSSLMAVGLASMAIGLFNLLPGFPLDGGRVVRAVLTGRGVDRLVATKRVVMIGRIFGVIAAVIGLYLLAVRDMWGVLWLAAGWFVGVSAVSAGKREELSVAYDGLTMADAMRPTAEAADGDDTISTMLDGSMGFGSRLQAVPVSVAGRVVGVIGQDEIDSVAPSRWPSMRVRALMTEIGPSDVVEANEPLESLTLRGKAGPAVVVRDGVVVGIVDGV